MQQSSFIPDSVLQLLPFTLMGAFWGLLWMIIWYLVLSLPLRLIIYYTSHYKLAIRCRKLSHWLLIAATLICAFFMVNVFSFLMNYKSFFSGEFDSYRQMFLPLSFMMMFIIPLYYILGSLLGKLDFYSTDQVPYLRYFILYLRSFKEDSRRKSSERRLMRALSKIYQPYAIGQPNEFMPPRGAKRIYAGDDWQEAVLRMQHEAPIILQRINISEGYLWEFEQCVEHGYLGKVIFWVTDFKQYESFRQYAKEEYLLDFPELHQQKAEEQVFYLREDGTFRIHLLDAPEAYRRLIDLHREDHPHHLEENLPYFWKRDSHLLKEAFDPRYDAKLMPGINRMSWVGLLFPKYYLICHRIRYRIPLYLLFAGIQAVESLYPTTLYQLAGIRMLTNVLLAYVFCRNGRRLVWLSERWESKEYYEKIYRRNTFWAVFFGILFNLLWIWGARNGIAIRIR